MAINKAMLAALKALSYPDIDIKKTYRLERQLHEIGGKPIGFIPWDHIVEYEGHEVPVRLFAPENKIPKGILLFFHGGGWVLGNIDSYTKVCLRMAKLTGHLVISADYRLAPEYKFPAAPEDCYAVAKEIYSDASYFGIPSSGITLIGDSAGGNLAAAVSLMARDRGDFLPSRQILIYPATHWNHFSDSPFESVQSCGTDYLLTSKRICDYMDLYASSPEDYKHPYFSPLEASSLEKQPKTMILTAQFDPLRDEGELYGDSLRAQGNYVEMHRISGALHGFFSLPPHFALVKRAYGYINRFLSEVECLEKT